MSKIEEFEQRIIANGMTDDDFAEYEKLLKRVRGNFSKRQHCYTTAIQFPAEYAGQAIRLIQYGLERYEDDWFSTYTSYLFMGHIYENIGDYAQAFSCYLSAKNALGDGHAEYEPELSIDLLWMKLHRDSFAYSEELEAYYSQADKAGEFSKALVNNAFRLAVARIVLSLHDGKRDEAAKWIATAREMCEPGYVGRAQDILSSHNYQERLKVTSEAVGFIRSFG